MLQKHTASMITPDMFQEHMPKVMLPGAYWNIISGQSFSGAPYLTMLLHGRGGSFGISTLPLCGRLSLSQIVKPIKCVNQTNDT